MSKTSILAKFWECNNQIYRKDTRLIFNGYNEECIGLVIMLNPGSLKPAYSSESLNAKPIIYSCKPDHTLNIVTECIEKAYGSINQNPKGYISIVNLFDVKQPNSKNLTLIEIKSFESFSKEVPLKYPWVWIAWGKDRIELNQLKEDILHSLDMSKVIGIKENGYYHHPRTIQIQKEKNRIISQIIEKIS